MDNLKNNKDIAVKFLADALPNNDVEYVKSIITDQTVTHRAGFAALYEATGFPIAKDGNFLEWVENGWSLLHSALTKQHVEMRHVVAEENKVILQYHYTVMHSGDFAGMPATGKKIEWDEVGILQFNNQGKIVEMWYMCEEMKVATELGYKLEK
ncbi:hypothetical protein EFP35_16345 [Lactiplantibacillus pentosus]|jgi:predicted ester cyclase|uniref:ester cyclase n=1 Tax=Lactiplantibacillus pentosus TaxID=1589 RepID=UPI001CFF7620|nr:ester cyclase [Lactiplantibacillus pentosus]MCB5221456.1 ester cyclase [Lactiplantibacillus pentosus]MCT3291554.1 hypothetical protein [Lactiplantibacillus pentosus]